MSEEVPNYESFIAPLFEVLTDRTEGIATSEAYEEVAELVGLSEAQRAQTLSSSSQPVYKNRIGWAHDRLKRAGLSQSKRRGVWQLTDDGEQLAEAHPEGLPADVVDQIARSSRSDFVLNDHLAHDETEQEAEETNTVAEESENFTAAEAAKIVLADADEALHYKEITRRALDKGLWQTDADEPAATMVSVLSVDIKEKGNASEFRRDERATYALNIDGLEESSSAEVDESSDVPSQPTEGSLAYQTLSFTDAAERILQVYADREPMNYSEITDRALDLNLIETESQNPANTMYSSLIQETERRKKRGDQPRFEFPGDGEVALTRWNQTGLTAYIEAHNDGVRRNLRERLQKMNPKDFEELVERLLVALGFQDVAVTSYSNDGGIDVRGTLVVGEVIRTRMAVQVKKQTKNVRRPIVQQVRGSLGSHEQGLIITTSDFSAGAYEEAKRSDAVPVALMNGDQLVKLLVEHDIQVEKESLSLLRLA